jgi:hypothetical protein
MRTRTIRTSLAVIALLACHAAEAALIQFSTIHLGGTQWRNTYTLVLDAADQPLHEFTIHFSRDRYANLELPAAPAGWSALAVQPDLTIPADGFYDALALMAPAAANTTLPGFSIVFDYAGLGRPGPQAYDIVDPDTFAVLDSGQTVLAVGPQPVPEPASLGLFLLGAVALLRRRS